MKRPVYRTDYELAYCAWLLIAPEWVARFPRPALSPWFALFADVATSGVKPRADDTPGQHFRRAILQGATPEQPFPGEVRGRALLVESAVRRLTTERLAELGTPAAICRALGPAVALVPASRTA